MAWCRIPGPGITRPLTCRSFIGLITVWLAGVNLRRGVEESEVDCQNDSCRVRALLPVPITLLLVGPHLSFWRILCLVHVVNRYSLLPFAFVLHPNKSTCLKWKLWVYFRQNAYIYIGTYFICYNSPCLVTIPFDRLECNLILLIAGLLEIKWDA